MKKSQRKARIKELKQRQKERRKQQREPEQAQPAPQPAAQPATKEVMETTLQEEIFTTDEVRSALRGALETVLRVKRMVHKAIETVNEEDANRVFALRVSYQRQRDDKLGLRSDENSVIRVHPLFALWKLADQCAMQVEKLLRLTNPKEFAKWKLAADKAAKAAAKLEQQAQKAAA